jgi:peptidylprolyl isomerase
MKKIVLIFLCIMITSLISLGQLPKKIKVGKTYTTESGLQIKFFKINKKAKQPVKDDKVKMNVKGKLLNDTVWVDSYLQGTPLLLKVGETSIKGLDEGLCLLHIGDSAVLTIPSALGFGDKAMSNVPANSTLIMTIKLTDIMIQPKPYETAGMDTIALPSGLKYIIVNKGKGIKVDSGMTVKVHYTGFFEDGKIFDSSVERGEAIEIPIGKGKVIKGWDEGITKLHVGDKAKLFIPYQLAYGETARGPIPAKSNLIFDVEVINAVEVAKVEAYDVKGKDTLTTASGLQYIVVKEGTGVQATAGKTVKVNYTGYFTSGAIFDSSVERNDPFSFALGKGNVIAGWDEGVALMKVGEKVRLIIPYTLGYGANDYGPIPGKSTLIFDVELLDVK